MDIGAKIYYRAINIKHDKIGKTRNPLKSHNLFKSRKLKNIGIDLAPQLLDKSYKSSWKYVEYEHI